MNYRGIVAYRGSAYKGFQRQKSLQSIQGTLEDVISELLGEKALIHGAGRTDAGVHAHGQGFSFKTEKTIADVEHFAFAMNRLLPRDIFVVSLEKASDSFDARHSVCGKVYSYRFNWGPRDPLQEGLLTQLERPSFDYEKFMAAMLLYKGRHNFQNFTTKSLDKDGFVRDITSVEFTYDPSRSEASVSLAANGFMTYMVRLMVGTAFRVALGALSLEEVASIIGASERKIVSYKAPPEGLYLEKVIYEPVD
jgi:tRNA pseudouridine38-40 synthase